MVKTQPRFWFDTRSNAVMFHGPMPPQEVRAIEAIAHAAFNAGLLSGFKQAQEGLPQPRPLKQPRPLNADLPW